MFFHFTQNLGNRTGGLAHNPVNCEPAPARECRPMKSRAKNNKDVCLCRAGNWHRSNGAIPYNEQKTAKHLYLC